MAGLIALFEANTSPQERDADFQRLLVSTSHFKKLELPKKQAVGRGCTAAKLDAPSSLHRGIIRNPSTGSWLLATGTVVALQGNNDPHGLLEDFLQGYLDQGVKVLDRYDGHFALVLYNGRDGSLSILSDPMGLFAIYYARRGGQVLISTSALAVAKMVNPKVDTMTLDCFLRTGRSYGEKTLWQDVKKVLPATLIKISSDQFEEREYWTPSVDEHIAHLKLTPALVLADDKISRNFELALAREGKVWSDLTGGYDTRVTTMYLDKLGIPFSTYCVGPQGHPDVEISKLVSREMGWEYFPYLLPDEWGDEQFQWFDAALGRGDGLLNIFHLTGVLKLAKERSAHSFATVPVTGVDEWRYHIFGANTLIASTLSRVNYDTILDAKIMENRSP